MDRIGGSGVFARDPDAILTMTPHALEEHFTIEATLRNFAPQDPFVVKWEWPLFHRDNAIDPKELKQAKDPKLSKAGQFQTTYSTGDIIEVLKTSEKSLKPGELLNRVKEQTGMAPTTFWRLWKEAKKSPYIMAPDSSGRFSHIPVTEAQS
jgi:hypothetical protein